MTTTVDQPPESDSDLLDALAESRALERVLHSERLHLVIRWAESHPGTGDTTVLSRDEHPGGDGTPTVAAFSAEPLAHALQCSPREAAALLADALDLAHRHPRLWDQVHALTVDLWKARRVARAARCLPLEGARWVDRQLLGLANSLGVAELDRLVATAVARFSPELQRHREDRARDDWDVTIEHPRDWRGTSTVHAVGDTHALIELHTRVQERADALPPSEDTAGQRRFRAMALLVREGFEQEALTLSSPVPMPARRPRHRITLHVHVDLSDLTTGTSGIGVIEGLGPATLELIRSWCAGSGVRVQPILDLSDQSWSPRHDPPPRMAEQVTLRDQRCIFPHCTRPARRCDLDHIVAWHPSQARPLRIVRLPAARLGTSPPPPGLHPERSAATGTTSVNLAPLCRRHHRAKTAGVWTYERLGDGSYWWTGPHGQGALVTASGTSHLP